MTSLNVVFAGTPEFGLPCLEALLASKHHLQTIYTQPDRPKGRGRALQASAVKTWAIEHNIPIKQPLNFKTPEAVEALAALKPDVMIVVAYGLLLPTSVLTIPRFGCINVHASLLPRWRGASPIQQAILHGDKKTGITIMQMDKGMDTGNMLTKATIDISATDSAGDLHDKLALLAPLPLLQILDALTSNNINAIIQDETQTTLAPKIIKEDAAINWHASAIDIDKGIRAYNPWPIAFTKANDLIVRVYQASVIPHPNSPPGTILSLSKQGLLVATGEDALLIEKIQLPGKKASHIAEIFHSLRHTLVLGSVLE